MFHIRSDLRFVRELHSDRRYGDHGNFVAMEIGFGPAVNRPSLAHEKLLPGPAVAIQTDFRIDVPVHPMRFALPGASPVHLVYLFAAGGLTKRV